MVTPGASRAFQLKLEEYRRHLHERPELSWEEQETSNWIITMMQAMGLNPRRLAPDAPTGIVCDIEVAEQQRASCTNEIVALRADMDALPIQEATGLTFASTRPGVMHACGHDCHMTWLLGAAEILLQRRNELRAPVRLLFQPAEERADGARGAISAGALDWVALIFGGHVDRHYTLGHVIVHDGAVNASSDGFEVELKGPGGHAARPHQTSDVIVAASALVQALQTIVSREINPASPCVITVGKLIAGTVGNAIASRAELEGTIRTNCSDIRATIIAAIERVTHAVGQLHKVQTKVTFRQGIPPLVNTLPYTDLARSAVRSVSASLSQTIGIPIVPVPLASPNMGGEDFSFPPGKHARPSPCATQTPKILPDIPFSIIDLFSSIRTAPDLFRINRGCVLECRFTIFRRLTSNVDGVAITDSRRIASQDPS